MPPGPVWVGHDSGKPPPYACDGCLREVGERGEEEKEELQPHSSLLRKPCSLDGVTDRTMFVLGIGEGISHVQVCHVL